MLDDIKELWEALNEHHKEKSLHFKEFYNMFSFDTRKADLIKQAQNKHMQVVIALDDEVQIRVGHCISSVDRIIPVRLTQFLFYKVNGALA